MFDRIGEKIKAVAKVLFWIEVLASVVTGIVMIDSSEGMAFIFITLPGILLAWVSALFVYGFGEIIDKLTAIEKNTRKDGTVNPDSRLEKIKELYDKGLITEDEYCMAIEKKRQES